MRAQVIAVMVALLSVGCTRTGNYVEPQKVQKISRAKTSKEVMKALGPPSVTAPAGEGKTMWLYVGQHKSPSLDSFVPFVGAVTGRENQICSQLSMIVDDKTGAVSDMKYTTKKDADWQYMRDESCR